MNNSKRPNVFKRFIYQKQQKRRSDHCCVPQCSASSKFNGILTFHRFPADAELRKKWLINICRDKFHTTENTKVCSRHFTPHQLVKPIKENGRTRVAKGAVPVLFEWNSYGLQQRQVKSFHSCNFDLFIFYCKKPIAFLGLVLPSLVRFVC